MSLQDDLLFARHAIQLGFVTESAVAEVLRDCAGRGLGAELLRRNLLTPEEIAAIESVLKLAARRRPEAPAGPAAAARPPRVPGTEPLGPPMRGGDAAAGIVGTVALGKELASGSDAPGGRLTAAEVSRSGISREGQIVLALGQDQGGAFAQLAGRSGLRAGAEDPDLLSVPESALPEGSPAGRKLYVSRKVTRGRTLGEVLAHDVAGGGLKDLSGESRAMRGYEDACAAIAWAHRFGLVHGRLRPDSVLFGAHGEIIVADWDAAHFQGAAVAVEASADEVPPCYRAPELADAAGPADTRADVYALGGILYRILARRPPYPGDSPDDVLALQRSTLPPAPSKLGQGTAREVEEVALRALSPEPAKRPKDAAEFLRALAKAVAAGSASGKLADAAAGFVQQARESLAAYKAASAEADARQREARRASVRFGAASGAAKQATAAARAAEMEAVKALVDTEESVSGALAQVKGQPEARRVLAELHWEEYRHADEAGDFQTAAVHLKTLAQFNDGAFDVHLRGEGTLAVATEVYRCPCLRSGRALPNSEAVRHGYHLASGREAEGGGGVEGVRELEWGRPATLRAHGASCARQMLEGADVWAFRMVPQGPLRVPDAAGRGFPSGAGGVPAPVLRALFGPDSPFLAAGGVHLGKTPFWRVAVPAGSYLLVIARDGFRPLRVPVRVARCESVELKVTLYAPDEIPDGFIQIPAGKFGWQGDRDNPHALPAESAVLPEVFISRDPVTLAEYARFLDALSAIGGAERASVHAPRLAPVGKPLWTGPPWGEPGEGGAAAALPGAHAPWARDWPVLGISWEDALHYCAWLRRSSPWLITLPHELEWEKAARGPDRRRFPWGNGFDPSLCNCEPSYPDGPRPVSVQSFPSDESPCGVRGLAGNSRDFCLNAPGADFPNTRVLRGGFWCGSGIQLAASYRSTAATRHVSPKGGFRLALVTSL